MRLKQLLTITPNAIDKLLYIKQSNNCEYINFTLEEKNYKINLFFNNKTLNLIGWQTEDIYQNLVITFISGIEINKNINQNIFKLPSLN